jgi:dihydrodipicolinate synthase/N-acetylneuraminate lyase
VCAPIGGTNVGTYRVGLEDLGSTLRVTVTASNAAGSGVASSSPTTPVTFGGPANSVLPAIGGDLLVGSTLSVSTGTWSDPQAALAVVWQRCASDGTACSAIANESGTSYTLTDSDAGSVLEAVVTATNDGGSSSATSAATAVIGRPAAVPVAPASSTPPVISGDAVVGSTLTLDTGAWSDAQAAIAIVWQRCAADGTTCSPIADATGTTYALTDADAGSVVEAVVTATNAGGSGSATSAVTAVVVQAAPAAPVPPANSTVPALTGDAVVGSTLSADTGTWSDAQATFDVAWQRCAADGTACSAIAGATGTSYTLTDGDAGSVLEAVVTATNAGGSSSAVSSSSPVVTSP